jgi:hypothetical protein
VLIVVIVLRQPNLHPIKLYFFASLLQAIQSVIGAAPNRPGLVLSYRINYGLA